MYYPRFECNVEDNQKATTTLKQAQQPPTSLPIQQKDVVNIATGLDKAMSSGSPYVIGHSWYMAGSHAHRDW